LLETSKKLLNIKDLINEDKTPKIEDDANQVPELKNEESKPKVVIEKPPILNKNKVF